MWFEKDKFNYKFYYRLQYTVHCTLYTAAVKYIASYYGIVPRVRKASVRPTRQARSSVWTCEQKACACDGGSTVSVSVSQYQCYHIMMISSYLLSVPYALYDILYLVFCVCCVLCVHIIQYCISYFVFHRIVYIYIYVRRVRRTRYCIPQTTETVSFPLYTVWYCITVSSLIYHSTSSMYRVLCILYCWFCCNNNKQ